MDDKAEVVRVLDRAEAHLADSGYPPALHESLWSSDFLASFALVNAEEISRHLPKCDLGRAAHRAAIANLLNQLRVRDVVLTLPGGIPAREALLGHLQEFLSACRQEFPPDTVHRLRWELHAAASAGDLRAVVELGPQWRTVDIKHLELVSRTAFLLLMDLLNESDRRPELWDSEISGGDPTQALVWNLLARISVSKSLERIPTLMSTDAEIAEGFVSGLTGSSVPACAGYDPERLAGLVQQIPEFCLTYLGFVPREQFESDSMLLAVAGWCEAALAERSSQPERNLIAARWFVEVAGLEAFDAPKAAFRAAAALCFAKARHFAHAEDEIRECIRLSPKDVEARKRLAEYLYKQDRIPEAIDAFEKYVQRTDETTGEDWSASLLLKLGLESLSNRQLATTIEAAAFGSPFRSQGEALVRWLAPWTSGLSQGAADKWWAGLFILTDETARANLGEKTVLQFAGAAFGEAVSMQLRECVARPFSSTLPPNQRLDEYWSKFVSGTATLGQQLSCLLQTRHPNSEIAHLLQAWLGRHAPGLSLHLKKKGNSIMALAALRGDATHGEINGGQVRQLFEEAKGLLTTVPAPKTPAPE